MGDWAGVKQVSEPGRSCRPAEDFGFYPKGKSMSLKGLAWVGACVCAALT